MEAHRLAELVQARIENLRGGGCYTAKAMSDQYSEEEWRDAVEGRPLAGLPEERFLTLHRHWIWADSAFRWFQRELATPTRVATEDVDLAGNQAFSMYLWYSLLWSVIEGIQKQRVVIRGAFREEVRRVREPLRDARNAVMHVSDDGPGVA